MKTIAFFNNKGGVGKTSLLYHFGYSLADLGVRVVLVDLDPQANLSALCIDEERLEQIWEQPAERRQTVFGAVHPVKEELGDIRTVTPENVAQRVSLIVGDIELSTYEAKLADAWPRCLDRHTPSFRATSAFYRTVRQVVDTVGAQVALIDVGPNLGALNRAALIAADWVVTPLNADLFSIQGLRNLGPTLSMWRTEWSERLPKSPDPQLPLPGGMMQSAGYCIVQPNLYGGEVTRAYQRWIRRVPEEYAAATGAEAPGTDDVLKDPWCLGVVKHYRSLMALAHEARKPVFKLTSADGALGSHAVAARQAGAEFRALARRLARQVGLDLPATPGANGY